MDSQRHRDEAQPQSALYFRFYRILQRPYTLLACALICMVFAGSGLTHVVKDPSVDAFVPADHPAALARDKARETFGLEDPMVIALAASQGQSVFTPQGLATLRALHDAVRGVEGIKKNDVISLASESALWGDDGDLKVEPILPEGSITSETAKLALKRTADMPMLTGLLVSDARDMALIIAPVEDANHAEAVYQAVMDIASTYTTPQYSVHVAGVAAMNARLADMVSANTKRFIPLAVLIVLAFLWVALGTPKAIIGPLVVIAGAAIAGIGAMGWVDARYYLISSALPVVIMAIAVADSLHISSFYMALRRANAQRTAQDAMAEALQQTCMPVILTSVTTVAGFVGLSFGAAMQPISEFGWFASVGVIGALVFSFTALPAVVVLTDLKPAPKGRARWLNAALDSAAKAMTQTALRAPIAVLAAFVLLTAIMALLGRQAVFDYERQRYFLNNDPVRIADSLIADRIGGVNFLDVVVHADREGDLMTPKSMAALKGLQNEVAQLPHVVKVTGIQDYIALMHEALTGASAGILPTARKAPAQYMFLYEASAPPDDFRQEIDYLHQNALLRAQLNTDSFQKTRPVVDRLETRLREWRKATGLDAEISGRVAVNDGWMSLLARNHFRGLGLAALLVWFAAFVSFRRLAPSILVMIPVVTGVMSIYAVMGVLGIAIAPATSMMAAISTGLGVDFGVHLMAHVRRVRASGGSWDDAFSGHYPLVARACFYSAAALALALSVLLISTVPVLRWFGLLIASGAIGSLIGALFLLPALQLSVARFRQRRLQNA